MMKLTDEQVTRVKSLEDEHGRLTAAQVVTDARREDSPLHSLFDWDAAKAAESHWLDVARSVIRTVQIVITTTEATIRAPFYTRDPEAQGQGYRSVVALQSDPENARESLIGELTRAAGNLSRARSMAAVLGLSDEVDELLARLTGLQRAIVPPSETGADEARPS